MSAPSTSGASMHASGPPLPEPLQSLCKMLPESPVEFPSVRTTVFPLLLDVSPQDIAQQANLGGVGDILAQDAETAEQFLLLLLELEEPRLVIQALPYLLTPRDGLWWAFQCIFDSFLDVDRARLSPDPTQSPTAEEAPSDDQAESSGTPPPPTPEQAEQQKAATGGLESALQQADAAIEALGSSLRDRMGAAVPSAVGSAAARDPFAQWMDDMWAGRFAGLQNDLDGADSPSARPVPMPAIEFPPASQPAPAAPQVQAKAPSRKMQAVQSRVEALQRRCDLRCLAATLQWILEPSQQAADQARTATEQVRLDSPGLKLATTAFWCGENLNVNDPSSPVVPPPGLAQGGVQMSVQLAADIDGGSWSPDDRLHWFCQRGLDTAAGTRPWTNAMEAFEQYHKWIHPQC